MGKDKTAQRTKGNQKPSSSGRTAELLGGVSGFIGFSALGDLGYVPAANNGSQEDDTTISSDFRVALRKMSKKDATTKIKALQEFETLCESEDIESIITVLPFWPRLYSKLSIDVERRVREAAQSSHGALSQQVGKQLAPYLKGIMPTWLLAMCDPHVPAATNAVKAFQGAFTDEKRAGVMIFCCKEIFDHIGDNLFTQTPETLSDIRMTSPEEMENKYIRVLSCSLSGLGLFLSHISSALDKKPEVLARLKPLLVNDKYWKLSKHRTPLVRGAWFALIKSLFEYDVSVMEDFTVQLSQTIYPAMGDPDPSVLSHIWIAFLHFTVGIKECWKHCSSPRSLFGRLFSVLQDGCHGNAKDLCPQLLPILSVIPDSIIDSRENFYVDFLKAISTGLRKDKVFCSTRESSAIITALFECLKYISKENICSMDVWETIMKYQVIDLISNSWDKHPQLCRSVLYIEVGSLLSFWNILAQDNTNKPFCELLDLFWKLLLPEFQATLQRGKMEDIYSIESFFLILKDPNSPSATRLGGIKFDDESTKTGTDSLISRKNIKDLVNKDIFICHCSKHLSYFIKDCFDKYNQENNVVVYQCFSSLLSLYPSKDVFSKLVDVGDATEGNVLAMEVIKRIVFPVMDSHDCVYITAALKIFMSLYSLLSQEEQSNILIEIQGIMNDVALHLLVNELTCKGEIDRIAAAWLRSSELNGRLVLSVKHLFDFVNKNPSEEDDDNYDARGINDLIKLIWFILHNGKKSEPIFSSECLQNIMSEIQGNLPEINTEFKSNFKLNNKRSLKLLCDLTTQLFKHSNYMAIQGIEDFIYKIFLQLCYNSSFMSPAIYNNLKTTFLKYMNEYLMLGPDVAQLFQNKNILNKMLKEIKQLILHQGCSFQSTLLAAEITSGLLLEICVVAKEEQTGILLDCLAVQTALDILMPLEGEWLEMETKLSSLYVAPDILHDSITIGEFLLPKNMQEDPAWNQDFVRTSTFFSSVLVELCNTDEDSANELVSLGAYIPTAIYSLHAVCHATSLLSMTDALDNDIVSDDIRLGTKTLQKNMQIIIERINSGNKKYIVKQIKDKCSDGSTFWTVTLKLILTKWIKNDIDAVKLFHSIDDSSLGATPIKQILLPLLPRDEIVDILAEETAKLSSLMDDPFSAVSCVSLITASLAHLSDDHSLDTINVLFTVLVHWRETVNYIFLFASDVSILPWEEVLLIVTVVRLITVIVKGHSRHLQHSYWDFILCSQSSWMQSLNETLDKIDKETVVGMFCCAVCKCVGCVSQIMETLRVDKEMQDRLPATLLEEWDEFFSPSVFSTLLPLFLDTTKSYDSCRTILHYFVCRCICIGVSGVGTLELTKHSLPALFNPLDDEIDFKLPEKHQVLLNHLCGLLLSNHPPTQYSAYRLLTTALPSVMNEWEKNTMKEDEQEDSTAKPIPPALYRLLIDCGGVVEAAIGDQELDSDTVILPHTDAYLYSSTYLLTWSLVLKAISLTPETSQHQYSAYLRENDLYPNLLVNLFRLMPQKPFLSNLDGSDQKEEVTMFTTELDIQPTLGVTSLILSWLACRVYYSCVSHLPAAVRLWWTNLDRHSQQIIDKFTRTYVSPLLIQQELSGVNSSNVKSDNMTIRARPGAREVIATYTIDEASMELVLRMAHNHPLSTVTVEDHKRVGVSLSQWRNCIFGLNIQLTHRNTPLVQSLEFWKCNIDQMFEGVEECYICYYVLHGTNHQLPKLLCRTCKKKFHSACLYKWFNTSNNSTCPLCRSLF